MGMPPKDGRLSLQGYLLDTISPGGDEIPYWYNVLREEPVPEFKNGF